MESENVKLEVFARSLREFFMKTGSNLTTNLFRTVLCEVEATTDTERSSDSNDFIERFQRLYRAIPTTSSSDPNDLNPISPSHIVTMKTQVNLPTPGAFERGDLYLRGWWRHVQYFANLLWSRWREEYLVSLQKRLELTKSKRNIIVSDIALIKDDALPRNE